MAINVEKKGTGNLPPDEDMFDAIVMAEERFHEEGYQEGFSAGQITGERDGFKMGQDKGKQIGSEYGFYLGFVATWQKLVKKDPRLVRPKTEKALDALHTLLVSFQVEDITYDKYWEDLKKIRDKFKQVASLLNVTLDFTDEKTQKPPLSF